MFFFLSLAPVTAETVNKSVDLPSVRRLAKRLYTLDGFQSIDVARHLCKRYRIVEILSCCSIVNLISITCLRA